MRKLRREGLLGCIGILLLRIRALGSRKKIIPHLACLLVRLLRYIHRHVPRYAPLGVPCRRTQIRRNLVELYFTVTLSLKTEKFYEVINIVDESNADAVTHEYNHAG
jgi:hypothetical protein